MKKKYPYFDETFSDMLRIEDNTTLRQEQFGNKIIKTKIINKSYNCCYIIRFEKPTEEEVKLYYKYLKLSQL